MRTLEESIAELEKWRESFPRRDWELASPKDEFPSWARAMNAAGTLRRVEATTVREALSTLVDCLQHNLCEELKK